MIIHILHLALAVVEILLNAVSLWATPRPVLRIALTYQPQGFIAGSPNLRGSSGNLLGVNDQNGHIAPAFDASYSLPRLVTGSMQTVDTIHSARSTTSIVSDFWVSSNGKIDWGILERKNSSNNTTLSRHI